MPGWTDIKKYFRKTIWESVPAGLGYPKALLIKACRFSYVVIRDFKEDQLNLRAMSLVYTTILSMVPLLAVSFSVLKAFGVHNQMEPFLINLLAPLGPQGRDLGGRIIGFVENVKVGVLGFVSLSLLFYTVVSLIQKVESALNHIWKVRRPRPFSRRISDYISVLLIGPVLLFSALGLTASVMSSRFALMIISIEPFGTLYYTIVELLPYVFVILAFTFFFYLVPHTKVKARAAIVGGIFSGILWQAIGWGFASFVVTSAKYTIYSGFAILILFMVWLYLNWLILLLGGVIAFYTQYPQFLAVKKEKLLLNNRLKEKLAFLISYLIGRNFFEDKTLWTIDSLVEYLSLPVAPVQEILSLLQGRRFIIETADDPPAYIPARAVETIKLSHLLHSIREGPEKTMNIEEQFLSTPVIDGFFRRMDEVVDEALGEDTLKDLIFNGEVLP